MTKKEKPKLGEKVNSLFEPTTQKENPPEEVKREKGRPKHADNIVKTTISLNLHQVVWLDRLSSDIRATSGRIIDRGTLIRGILSAFEKLNLDITSCENEANLTEIIVNKFGGC